MTDRLLTAREVAGLLGVSAETVLRWTRRGDLPAIRLPGGALRYGQTALDKWITDRATSSSSARLDALRPHPGPSAPTPTWKD